MFSLLLSKDIGIERNLRCELTSHYENTPMQYTAIIHGGKNDNFPMKNCDIFSSPEQKAHKLSL